MNRDEFMHLPPEQQEMLVRLADIAELEELAEETGGWQAEVLSANVAGIDYATDPTFNMAKSLRSYFGSPNPQFNNTKKCGVLRLAPNDFCMLPDGRFDVDRYDAETLDFYFVLNQKGWKEAWSWARGTTADSGGVKLMNFVFGSFAELEEAAA